MKAKHSESFRYEVRCARIGAIRKESAEIIAKHIAQNEPMIRLAVEKSMLEALETVEPELAQAAAEGLLNGAEMAVSDGIRNTLNNYSRQAVNQLNLVNTVMLDGTLVRTARCVCGKRYHRQMTTHRKH